MPKSTEVLTEKEAAEYLGMSVNFLRRTRMKARTRLKAQGPDFFKVPGGRAVRYRLEDLQRWLEENIQK